MKTLINIFGPGASGKTSLTRALAGPYNSAFEFTKRIRCFTKKMDEHEEKVKFYISDKGLAIIGNYNNSSDSISNIDAQRTLLLELLDRQDVGWVVYDPVRASMKHVDWVQSIPNLAVLFVKLEITFEENLRRLNERRARNGEAPVAEGSNTMENFIRFRDRANYCWNHAMNTYRRPPVQFLTIYETVSTAEACFLVKSACKELLSSAGP